MLRYRRAFPSGSSTLTLHSRKSCNLLRGDLVPLHCRAAAGVEIQSRGCNLAKERNHWAPTQQHGTGEGLEVSLRNSYKKYPWFSLSLLKPLESSYQPQEQQKQKETWKHLGCRCGAHAPAPLPWALSSGAWKFN